MKSINVIRAALLLAVVCLAASCASTSKQADNTPRFNEATSANVVLQFNSWDYIFVTHPDYRENGFLRQIKREDLGQAFVRLGIQRNLAVVVLGWNYAPETTAKTVDEWKAILATYGFKRVVCLRASGGGDINGSVILDDSQLPIGKETRTAKL